MAAVRMAGPFSWQRLHHLAQSFIPLAGAGVFLGLSATTLSLVRHEGISTWWANDLRLGLLVVSNLAVIYLAIRIIRQWASGWQQLPAMALVLGGLAWVNAAWGGMCWWW